MDKGSSDHKHHRDTKEEGQPHVPLIHHWIGGEPMVVWILEKTVRQWAQTSRPQGTYLHIQIIHIVILSTVL